MLTAVLTIQAKDQVELDALLIGRADVMVIAMDVGLEGELLRHDLKPLLIEGLTATASSNPRGDYEGPLIRAYVQPVEQRDQ